MTDFGIYSQLIEASVIVRNNIIVDAMTGIGNLLVTGAKVVKQIHSDMKISIDSNLIVGRSDSFTCEDYTIRSESLQGSAFTAAHRAAKSDSNGPVGMIFPCFSEKVNKFPKVPLHSQVGAGYNSLNGRTCVSGNTFANFNADSNCMRNSPAGVVIRSNPLWTDHQHMVEMQKTALTNVDDANKVQFKRPILKNVNINSCADMPCDGQRRTYIKDMDDSLSQMGHGNEVSIFAQSEFQWDGAQGYDWSDEIDRSWGMGDYRIPESMQTMSDGTVIPIETYAPNKGFSRNDDCNWNADWLAYQCHGSMRGHLLFESLDHDTEIRRSAPFGFRSDSGFIDLGNGPIDHSCCSGYSCLLRATYNYFVVECGETYEIHSTGTLPTKVRFSMHSLPPTCKIRLKMFTMRQNRQDIYLNGNNLIYSNQYDFANDTWRFPDSSFIPEITEDSGSNYFDRADQMLHFVIGMCSKSYLCCITIYGFISGTRCAVLR